MVKREEQGQLDQLDNLVYQDHKDQREYKEKV